MTTGYTLHYAPDNASLIVRLALDEMGLAYRTVLVDRATAQQRSARYLRLNPNGLIPVLETPQGVMFETGAILLWLSDTHGAMAPAADHPGRADYLKWLFFVSNTLHADLRLTFYPDLYAGPDRAAQAALRRTVQGRLRAHLALLEGLCAQGPGWFGADAPSGLVYYVAACLRWMAIYPRNGDRLRFSLADTPRLLAVLSALEPRPAVRAACVAEGLGPHPFTAPVHPQPPEGSAT